MPSAEAADERERETRQARERGRRDRRDDQQEEVLRRQLGEQRPEQHARHPGEDARERPTDRRDPVAR